MVLKKSIMKYKKIAILALCVLLTVGCAVAGGSETVAAGAGMTEMEAGQNAYSYTEYSLERNGIPLHLDCVKAENTEPEMNILLMHGSTYSSHEFDVDYEDYSLVRRLAREGYAVWRLDIAGYGQSGEVEDGLMPDTAYAAEDIRAAVEWIARETGQNRIDLLGWSWGTMTAGRFVEIPSFKKIAI